jgi:hypothetical protein
MLRMAGVYALGPSSKVRYTMPRCFAFWFGRYGGANVACSRFLRRGCGCEEREGGAVGRFGEVLAVGLLCVGAFAPRGGVDGVSSVAVRGVDDAMEVGNAPPLERAWFPAVAAEPNTRTSKASSKPTNGTGSRSLMAG